MSLTRSLCCHSTLCCGSVVCLAHSLCSTPRFGDRYPSRSVFTPLCPSHSGVTLHCRTLELCWCVDPPSSSVSRTLFGSLLICGKWCSVPHSLPPKAPTPSHLNFSKQLRVGMCAITSRSQRRRGVRALTQRAVQVLERLVSKPRTPRQRVNLLLVQLQQSIITPQLFSIRGLQTTCKGGQIRALFSSPLPCTPSWPPLWPLQAACGP